MTLIYFDILRDNERLFPPRSVRLSNNKMSFDVENDKLSKRLLLLKLKNFHVKLRDV